MTKHCASYLHIITIFSVFLPEERQVELLILQPSQLQVAVHVGAVGVPVPEVPIVVLAVVGHRHATVGADAYWKRRQS